VIESLLALSCPVTDGASCLISRDQAPPRSGGAKLYPGRQVSTGGWWGWVPAGGPKLDGRSTADASRSCPVSRWSSEDTGRPPSPAAVGACNWAAVRRALSSGLTSPSGRRRWRPVLGGRARRGTASRPSPSPTLPTTTAGRPACRWRRPPQSGGADRRQGSTANPLGQILGQEFKLPSFTRAPNKSVAAGLTQRTRGTTPPTPPLSSSNCTQSRQSDRLSWEANGGCQWPFQRLGTPAPTTTTRRRLRRVQSQESGWGDVQKSGPIGHTFATRYSSGPSGKPVFGAPWREEGEPVVAAIQFLARCTARARGGGGRKGYPLSQTDSLADEHAAHAPALISACVVSPSEAWWGNDGHGGGTVPPCGGWPSVCLNSSTPALELHPPRRTSKSASPGPRRCNNRVAVRWAGRHWYGAIGLFRANGWAENTHCVLAARRHVYARTPPAHGDLISLGTSP